MKRRMDVLDTELTAMGMAAAFQAARAGLEAGELPIGAAVVLDGHVVSARHTEDAGQRRRLVHADFLALDDADRLRSSGAARAGGSLFVTLEPCMFCMGAATAFGIGEVHFALESPTDGASAAAQTWAASASVFGGYASPRIHAGARRNESVALLQQYVASAAPGGLARWARATLDALEHA